jgi:hypothetical protein
LQVFLRNVWPCVCFETALLRLCDWYVGYLWDWHSCVFC